jgi:hypothetical protein
LLGDGQVFGLDFETQAIVSAHVHVGHPDQGKLGDHIAPPPKIEHLEMRQDEEQCGHIVAEAIFAGEQVEEFTLIKMFATLASILAELSWLFEYLFVRDRPCNAGDGETNQEEEAELMRQRLVKNAWLHVYVAPDITSDSGE